MNVGISPNQNIDCVICKGIVDRMTHPNPRVSNIWLKFNEFHTVCKI
jgi:hypothetical protein